MKAEVGFRLPVPSKEAQPNKEPSAATRFLYDAVKRNNQRRIQAIIHKLHSTGNPPPKPKQHKASPGQPFKPHHAGDWGDVDVNWADMTCGGRTILHLAALEAAPRTLKALLTCPQLSLNATGMASK